MKMTRPLARAVALLGVALLFAGCSSGGSGSEGGHGDLTPVTVALDWTPNTNHTGLYVAINKGYFKAAGIDVKILPYNGAEPGTLVDAGSANFGFSTQDYSTFPLAAGADFQAVMAPLQHWSAAIGVRADNNDIRSPKDLDGRTYAGFGSPSEVPTLQAAIKHDGGTGDFKSVTLGTSAYEALYSGKVDFTVPYRTWEGIEAQLAGTPMKYFKFTDFGLPDCYSFIVIGNKTWMGKNTATAKAFTQALAKGYEDAVKDPDGSSAILMGANAGVLTNKDLVVQSQQALSRDYMLDPSGKFGQMTAQQWSDLTDFYFHAGLLHDGKGNALSSVPDTSSFFTNTYLTP